MTADQLALDLRQRPVFGRAAFFEAPSNAMAVALVDGWRDWTAGMLALIGPEGSGKTHLAHAWAEDAVAVVIHGADLADGADLPPDVQNAVLEDLDRLDDLAPQARARVETEALHLFNRTREAGGRLLLTGRTPPARWPLLLPDLLSRLSSVQTVTIRPPDDALLSALLVKFFGDRQITVTPQLIAFVATRIDRSFVAAERAVEALDAAALASGKSVSVRLARQVLAGPDTDPDSSTERDP